jgi:hypothetical protein
MSSHVRRQHQRNYYHHRGDAFGILLVPSDADAGRVTRAQLEKQARELESMGIYPPRPPIAESEYASPVYTFDNVAGWATIDASIMFDPTAVPGFFQIIIADRAPSTSYTLAIRLRNNAGHSYQGKSASGLAFPQVFGVQLLNHGWAQEGPLAGQNLFSMVRVYQNITDDSLVGAVQADCIFTIQAYCNSSVGQSTLQLFGYVARSV